MEVEQVAATSATEPASGRRSPAVTPTLGDISRSAASTKLLICRPILRETHFLPFAGTILKRWTTSSRACSNSQPA